MTLESDAKFEEKLTCGLENNMKNLARALESLKIGTLMGFFCPKLNIYELKITGELCVMTMKNDAKIELPVQN